MKTTPILYNSAAFSVARFQQWQQCQQWLAHPVPSSFEGDPLPRSSSTLNRRRPAPCMRLARTALAAIIGTACACGAAFAVGTALGPIIGFLPAFIPAAAAASVILFLTRRLAGI